MGVSTNITGRKKNQEQLSRLAAIGDASEDAITMHALDGTVLIWNKGAEKITGYSAEEVIGRNINRILPLDAVETEHELAESEGIQESVRRGESLHHLQVKRIRKDGRLILMLRQAAKLESLGVLAGGIAHDFNNLLVVGNASLLSDILPPASPARPMLAGLIEASERAAPLIRQLLAYAGKGKFVIQPLDLSGLVGEMIALVRASVPKTAGLQLRLAPVPRVVGDVAQLQQLVMNLVINAAEAIGQNPGLVTVTTVERQIAAGDINRAAIGTDPIPSGRYIVFEVEDNGVGMDEATMAKIFDPFFTTKFTGRGLGLSAALGIVRGHEGFIQVASSPGRGSTFKVLFPAGPEQTAPPRVPEGKDDLAGSGVILLVDDEDLVRGMAASTLAHWGYTVLEAANGEEAIDLFKRDSSRIVLVILDLSMPVIGGDECLSRLKSIKPDIPVLLSSGFSETEATLRFQSFGAGYLQKPYTAKHLAKLVKAALSNNGETLGRVA
jgi:PAS domain S-box-containing protein